MAEKNDKSCQRTLPKTLQNSTFRCQSLSNNYDCHQWKIVAVTNFVNNCEIMNNYQATGWTINNQDGQQ